MIKVGYINNTYAEKRNIIEIIPKVQYINMSNIQDINKNLLKVLQENSNLKCFQDRIDWFQRIKGSEKINLIHTFNSVCLTKEKWVSTFESVIPRVVDGKYSNIVEKGYRKYLVHKGIKSIKKDNCIKLIAMSQSAYDIQKAYLATNCKDSQSILAKTQILHPAQKMLIEYNELEEKFSDIEKEIRFLFIGRAFFRKGGAAICKVLSEFRKNYPIKLTIASNFMSGDYGISISKSEKQKLMKWLRDNESWITCYNSMPNRGILELAKYSHIGLLTSYCETYGYSALELQAAGCPVITTDIGAFPEINDNKSGWICKIAKDLPRIDLNHCDIMNEEVLGKEFHKAVETILNNINSVEEKGRQALYRIETEHSIKKYANALLKIYCQ